MRILLLSLVALCVGTTSGRAAEWTAPKLAGAMAAAVQDGDATARVKMTSPDTGVLQIRIKSRRTAGDAAVVYEILWPNERKGETFVLRQSGAGSVKTAGGVATKLGAADMAKSVFGTALAYADVVENFFLWDKQSLDGTEAVGRTECVILESRPGADDATIYGKVRSWIDPQRLVAMRVEKYDESGRLVRRIETTQVAKDDNGRNVPAGMSVRAGGKVTEIDGTNIRHDVTHSAGDFDP